MKNDITLATGHLLDNAVDQEAQSGDSALDGEDDAVHLIKALTAEDRGGQGGGEVGGAADAHGDQDDHGDGQGADLRPHLVGGGDRLEQGRGDTGGQAHAAAGGQVGAGQHDTAADAQCGRQIGRRLGEDVDE